MMSKCCFSFQPTDKCELSDRRTKQLFVKDKNRTSKGKSKKNFSNISIKIEKRTVSDSKKTKPIKRIF